MNGCTRNGNAGDGAWRPRDAPVGRLQRPNHGSRRQEAPAHAARRVAAAPRTGSATAQDPGGRLSVDDRQPAVRPGAPALHQNSDRYRHRQASDGFADSAGAGNSGGDADSGRNLVFPYADSFQSRPTPDRRTAPESPAAHRPAPGGLLRRQQERRPGLAHHDRCGRRTQPDRHGTGGLRRRFDDRRDLLSRLADH